MGHALRREKKLFARQAEVFAGYTAYTDHEIGRVIQAVEDMGKLDNTLIIYICGDNGTSPEGTLVGTPSNLPLSIGRQARWARVPFRDGRQPVKRDSENQAGDIREPGAKPRLQDKFSAAPETRFLHEAGQLRH